MEKNNTPPATDFLESAKTFGIKALSLILSAFMLWEMMSIAYSYIILPAIFAFSVIAVGYIMLTDEAFQSFREKLKSYVLDPIAVSFYNFFIVNSMNAAIKGFNSSIGQIGQILVTLCNKQTGSDLSWTLLAEIPPAQVGAQREGLDQNSSATKIVFVTVGQLAFSFSTCTINYLTKAMSELTGLISENLHEMLPKDFPVSISTISSMLFQNKPTK